MELFLNLSSSESSKFEFRLLIFVFYIVFLHQVKLFYQIIILITLRICKDPIDPVLSRF